MVILLLFIFQFVNTEKIPLLNQRVIQFVNAKMGEKVGEGECWDLAAGALEYAGGFLDRSSEESLYIFGKRVNPRKETIYPGDIIQFENVEIQYIRGNTIFTESMPHHTAIIYEVLGPGRYRIAHQNSTETGKKAGISTVDLNKITKGVYFIYRPIPAG